MNKDVGEPIHLTYVRPGEPNPVSRTVELAMLPRPIPDGGLLAQTWFEMSVSELTAAVARRFNFENAYPILIITEIQTGGPADRAGLEPGDLILQINDATVRDLQEFSLQMEKVAAGDVVEVQILRITLGLFGQMERRFLIRVQARRRLASVTSGWMSRHQ